MVTNCKQSAPRARLATMEEILLSILPLWLDPPPTSATLRGWFDDDRVQRLKANPHAKRGGGPVYYLVADVERCLRNRIRVSTAAISTGGKQI
jgi:hypothetical protein